MKNIKKYFNKTISITLIFCFLLVNIVPEIAYGEQITAETNKKEFLQSVLSIQASLHEMGLSLEDFKDIPQKSPEFYKEVEDYICEKAASTTISAISVNLKTTPSTIDFNEIFHPSELVDSSETKYNKDVKFTVEMLSYAREVAEINMKRDSNAKNLTDETVYMYMSHYIDRTPEPVYKVEPWVTDDVIFAGWITERDRRTYDNYLSYIKNADKLQKGAAVIVDVADIAVNAKLSKAAKKAADKVATTAEEEKTIIDYIKSTPSIASTLINGKILWNDINSYKECFIKYDDPAKVAEMIENSLDIVEDDYSILAKLSSLSLAFSLISTLCGTNSIIGLMVDVTATLIQFDLLAVKDMMEGLKWKAMVWTLSERSSERAMRYFGF